jgi:hypothetical protein
MENQNKVLEQIDFNTAVFIVGNVQSCFVFNADKTIVEIKQPIKEVSNMIGEQYFIQVNNATLINSKFFVSKKNGQHIKMEDGYLHKVFRRRWKDF